MIGLKVLPLPVIKSYSMVCLKQLVVNKHDSFAFASELQEKV